MSIPAINALPGRVQALFGALVSERTMRRILVFSRYFYQHALEYLSPRLSLERPVFRAAQAGVDIAEARDRTSSIEFYLQADANARKEFERRDAAHTAFVTNIADKFRTARCFVCDSPLTPLVQVIDADNEADFIEWSWCAACDHAQYSVMPGKGWFTKWYASNWDADGSLDEKLATRKPTYRYYRRLLPYLGDRKLKILEIGAGYGDKIYPFKEAGHEVHCTEASARRADYLRSNVTDHVYFGTLDDPAVERALRQNGPFDLIFTYHVIEHVYNPRAELQLLRDIARDGAIFYLAIPELYKEGLLNNIYSLEHIASFSRHSAKVLLEKLGFDVIAARDDPFQYYSNYCQYLIGKKVERPQAVPAAGTGDPAKMTRYLCEALQLDRVSRLAGGLFSYRYNVHRPLTYRVSGESKLKCRDPERHLPVKIYHRGLPLFWNYL